MLFKTQKIQILRDVIHELTKVLNLKKWQRFKAVYSKLTSIWHFTDYTGRRVFYGLIPKNKEKTSRHLS